MKNIFNIVLSFVLIIGWVFINYISVIPDYAEALWDYNLSVVKTAIVDSNNNGSYWWSDSTTEFYPSQTIQYNLNYSEVGTGGSGVILSDVLPDGVCFRLGSIPSMIGQTIAYFSDTSFSTPYVPNGAVGSYDCIVKSFKVVKNPSCVTTYASGTQSDITNHGLDSFNPDIALDNNGVVYKVRQEYITGLENYDILLQSWTNTPINISNSVERSGNPRLAVDPNNKIYVVWEENSWSTNMLFRSWWAVSMVNQNFYWYGMQMDFMWNGTPVFAWRDNNSYPTVNVQKQIWVNTTPVLVFSWAYWGLYNLNFAFDSNGWEHFTWVTRTDVSLMHSNGSTSQLIMTWVDSQDGDLAIWSSGQFATVFRVPWNDWYLGLRTGWSILTWSLIYIAYPKIEYNSNNELEIIWFWNNDMMLWSWWILGSGEIITGWLYQTQLRFALWTNNQEHVIVHNSYDNNYEVMYRWWWSFQNISQTLWSDYLPFYYRTNGWINNAWMTKKKILYQANGWAVQQVNEAWNEAYSLNYAYNWSSHFIWESQSGGVNQIRYSSWWQSIHLSSWSNNDRNPKLVPLGWNNFFALWTHLQSPVNVLKLYSHSNQSIDTIVTPNWFQTSRGDNNRTAITLDGGQNPLVVWQASSGNNSEVFYRNASGAISNISNSSSVQSETPKITYHPSWYPIIAWREWSNLFYNINGTTGSLWTIGSLSNVYIDWSWSWYVATEYSNTMKIWKNAAVIAQWSQKSYARNMFIDGDTDGLLQLTRDVWDTARNLRKYVIDTTPSVQCTLLSGNLQFISKVDSNYQWTTVSNVVTISGYQSETTLSDNSSTKLLTKSTTYVPWGLNHGSGLVLMKTGSQSTALLYAPYSYTLSLTNTDPISDNYDLSFTNISDNQTYTGNENNLQFISLDLTGNYQYSRWDLSDGSTDIYVYSKSTDSKINITNFTSYTGAISNFSSFLLNGVRYLRRNDRSDGSDNIYLYDMSLATKVKITNNSNYTSGLNFYGNMTISGTTYLVYYNIRNGNNNIYGYDIIWWSTINLTNRSNYNDIYSPWFLITYSGTNYLSFSDFSNGSNNIYLTNLTNFATTSITNFSNLTGSLTFWSVYAINGDIRLVFYSIWLGVFDYSFVNQTISQMNTSAYDGGWSSISSGSSIYYFWSSPVWTQPSNNLFLYSMDTKITANITNYTNYTGSINFSAFFHNGSMYFIYSDMHNGSNNLYLHNITTNQISNITNFSNYSWWITIHGIFQTTVDTYVTWTDRNTNYPQLNTYMYSVSSSQTTPIANYSYTGWRQFYTANTLIAGQNHALWYDTNQSPQRNLFDYNYTTHTLYNITNYNNYAGSINNLSTFTLSGATTFRWTDFSNGSHNLYYRDPFTHESINVTDYRWYTGSISVMTTQTFWWWRIVRYDDHANGRNLYQYNFLTKELSAITNRNGYTGVVQNMTNTSNANWYVWNVMSRVDGSSDIYVYQYMKKPIQIQEYLPTGFVLTGTSVPASYSTATNIRSTYVPDFGKTEKIVLYWYFTVMGAWNNMATIADCNQFYSGSACTWSYTTLVSNTLAYFSKSGSATSLHIGSWISYNLNYRWTGSPLTGIVVTDTIPSVLTGLSVSGSGCSLSGNVVYCSGLSTTTWIQTIVVSGVLWTWSVGQVITNTWNLITSGYILTGSASFVISWSLVCQTGYYQSGASCLAYNTVLWVTIGVEDPYVCWSMITWTFQWSSTGIYVDLYLSGNTWSIPNYHFTPIIAWNTYHIPIDYVNSWSARYVASGYYTVKYIFYSNGQIASGSYIEYISNNCSGIPGLCAYTGSNALTQYPSTGALCSVGQMTWLVQYIADCAAPVPWIPHYCPQMQWWSRQCVWSGQTTGTSCSSSFTITWSNTNSSVVTGVCALTGTMNVSSSYIFPNSGQLCSGGTLSGLLIIYAQAIQGWWNLPQVWDYQCMWNWWWVSPMCNVIFNVNYSWSNPTIYNPILTKSVSKAVALVNEVISYLIVIYNPNQTAVTGLVVQEYIPSDLTGVIISTNAGIYNSWIWSIANLAANSTWLLQISWYYTTAGTKTNSVALSGCNGTSCNSNVSHIITTCSNLAVNSPSCTQCAGGYIMTGAWSWQCVACTNGLIPNSGQTACVSPCANNQNLINGSCIDIITGICGTSGIYNTNALPSVSQLCSAWYQQFTTQTSTWWMWSCFGQWGGANAYNCSLAISWSNSWWWTTWNTNTWVLNPMVQLSAWGMYIPQPLPEAPTQESLYATSIAIESVPQELDTTTIFIKKTKTLINPILTRVKNRVDENIYADDYYKAAQNQDENQHENGMWEYLPYYSQTITNLTHTSVMPKTWVEK